MTGSDLRAWREAHGVGQAELGRRLGVSAITVYRWESGRRKPLPGRILELAIRGLECERQHPP